jgi:hypothetical protein
MATALATAVEKALETVMANQEGWAILGMSGDELTTHIVKQQQQHAYGTSKNGLIGCDGGPKYGRNYDGTKARPRADWCVSDGASRIWIKGKLEGVQNICDAEFTAKTVATIVCVDSRPNKAIIFDSKSSGSRYDKTKEAAKRNERDEPHDASLHRHPARVMIRSCANMTNKRQSEIGTRWTKSHKTTPTGHDGYANDSADSGCTFSRSTSAAMVPRLRSGSDDYFIARTGYGVYTKAVFKAVCTCAKNAMKFTATKNGVIVQHDILWPAAVAGIRLKNGRHSQMCDFAIKASAKALPTPKMLRSRYGDTIIDDITCPLCGSETDAVEHLLCDCPTTQHARDKIYNQLVCTINCTHHQPNDKENRKTSEFVLEGYEKEVDAITADGAHLCWVPRARVQTANASHTWD